MGFSLGCSGVGASAEVGTTLRSRPSNTGATPIHFRHLIEYSPPFQAILDPNEE